MDFVLTLLMTNAFLENCLIGPGLNTSIVKTTSFFSEVLFETRLR